MSVSFRDLEAHRNGDCNSWTCEVCEYEAELDLATCDNCGDLIPEGDGCDHDGRFCAACFIERCPECRADIRDDMAAEAAEDYL